MNRPTELKSKLSSLPDKPGVYQMLGEAQQVLYVGKARNLKNRVGSYFQKNLNSRKTELLMQQVYDFHIIITQTEVEALLLELNLIKTHKPRFNVLLRDDKSYPYIKISRHSKYPAMDYYRGQTDEKHEYFGPYPNVTAIKETLNLLQKLFKVRQCSDVFFKNRTRPCLQYQIGRCKAPCVAMVDEAEYLIDVQHTRLFLQGKDQQVIDDLQGKMIQAAERTEYEEAAQYRDQIQHLRLAQSQQFVSKQRGDVDVVAGVVGETTLHVQVLSVRGGRVLGSRGFTLALPLGSDVGEALSAFAAQHYIPKSDAVLPREIIVSQPLQDEASLQAALCEKVGRPLKIRHNVRGERARWLQMAKDNAMHHLEQALLSKKNYHDRWQALQEVLEMQGPLVQMECFDISHTQGENTVASCVVFNQEGPVKSQYRRFNIRDITAGDDYAAMKQALERRFKTLAQGTGFNANSFGD